MKKPQFVQIKGKHCHLVLTQSLQASLSVSAENQWNAGFLQDEILQQASDIQAISSSGRGKAWFLHLHGQDLVLRAYQRGGLVARVNKALYIGANAQQSRSFQEFYLLQLMYDQGLPVPEPVAASVCRWPSAFSPFYKAHILVRRLNASETLDHLLSQQTLSESVWQKVGQTIAQFHNAHIYHADLNANNILLDSDSNVYLIDFDKSEVRRSDNNAQWKMQNLQRLQRSLLKQQGIYQQYSFNEANWHVLNTAYREALA